MIDNDPTDGARQHRKLTSMPLAQGFPVVPTAKFNLRRCATGAHHEVFQHGDIEVYSARSVVEVGPRREILWQNDSL